jgi:hypothetical protein
MPMNDENTQTYTHTHTQISNTSSAQPAFIASAWLMAPSEVLRRMFVLAATVQSSHPVLATLIARAQSVIKLRVIKNAIVAWMASFPAEVI